MRLLLHQLRYCTLLFWLESPSFSIFWSNSLFEPGRNLICGILNWIKHNNSCVWGWSRAKIIEIITYFSKFDQVIFWISGDTPITQPEYILVWAHIPFWGTKVSRWNYHSSSTKCVSSAESADPFQFYLKLLHLSNTIKFQRTEKPAEGRITSSTLWG